MRRRIKIELLAAGAVAVCALVALLAAVGPLSFSAGWSGGPSLAGSVSTTRAVDRSEGAARRAAIGYLEATEYGPALGPRAAADAQRSMSSAASADGLAAEVEEELSALLELYPQVRIRIAPIESRTTARGDGWEVSIWYVGTFTLDDYVLEEWRTVTYRMVWERERWLIESFDSERGPVPARPLLVESTPGLAFEAALSGFADNVAEGR